MAQLEGKTALVTGASRGIGRAIAETFGREGANVIVNYSASEAIAENVVANVKKAGGRAVAMQADTTDPAALRDLFNRAEKVFGGLDIFVQNAHPGLGFGPITEIEEDVVDQQLAVLKSYLIGLQEAGRRVVDDGVIISISSSATRIAVPNTILYGAMKLAIEHLSRGLSRELELRNVRVLALGPGLTATDRVLEAGMDLEGIPHCGPQEIADAALFLASDAARWINAQTLFVNGGAQYAQ